MDKDLMDMVAKCDCCGDAFLNCYWDKVAVEQLPNGYQIAIRKL